MCTAKVVVRMIKMGLKNAELADPSLLPSHMLRPAEDVLRLPGGAVHQRFGGKRPL
jgi:hypothetical protein